MNAELPGRRTGRSAYPVRGSADPDGSAAVSKGAPQRHTQFYSDAALRRMLREFKRALVQGIQELPDSMSRADGIDSRIAGRDFAWVAIAWMNAHGKPLAPLHARSAFALLHRRVEGISARIDRIAVTGMAAVALHRHGLPVHIVVESDSAAAYCHGLLKPVFSSLELSCAILSVASSESDRRIAYQCDVTIVSARECAMDFMRDAINWPQRINQVEHKVDDLLGARARSRGLLMRGLYCAIHVDTDSTLVDNARTPIVLTRDAHPMHELEELKKAFEMIQHLTEHDHYTWIGAGAEVALTDNGRKQLAAWGEALGGIWNAPQSAELMLSAALTTTYQLVPGRHYSVEDRTVKWLVQQRLVPGMTYYGAPFLTRMVAIREDCSEKSSRETVARVSYQQVFNRYIHLCGSAHSVDFIAAELQQVYGLRSRYRWQKPGRFCADRGLLAKSTVEKMQQVVDWARQHDADSCRIILANSDDRAMQLYDEVSAVLPGASLINSLEQWQECSGIRQGALLIVRSGVMDYVNLESCAGKGLPVHILITQRSDRVCEDHRQTHWLKNSELQPSTVTLLLSVEDEIFGSNPAALRLATRISGARIAGWLLERRIRRIQRIKGAELYDMRKNLLTHDSGMQGILSFSGRGIYE